MRKLLLILFVFSCFFASAQKIQYVNTYGYEYQRIVADTLLGLPKDTFAVPTALRTIPFLANKSGTLYKWNTVTFAWDVVAGGSANIYVNLPLTLDGDTIEIAEASTINDGYLSAVNYTRFDSLRNHWYRGGTYGNYLRQNNTGDSVIIGVHPGTVHKFNITGNLFWEGIAYTTSNRRMMEINTGFQNVDIGGRSGNASRSGIENTFVGEFAGSGVTSGSNNTGFGKAAMGATTTGNNNVALGRNVFASGTLSGSNNIAIGSSSGLTLANSNQLNIGTWIYGESGRIGLGGIVSPTATLDLDTMNNWAPLRLRMRATPTSLSDGMIWHSANHLYTRLNGVTYQLDQQSASALTLQDVLDNGNNATTSIFMNSGASVIMSTTSSLTFDHGGGNSSFFQSGTTANKWRWYPASAISYFNMDGSLLTTTRNLMFPDEDDTIATRGWARANISGGGGDMTLAGVQSVTGLKTFDKDKLAMKGTSTGVTTISTANTSATNYTITLPAATGTVALAPTVGTYSTRTGLSPSDGTEFFQTNAGRDGPPGKYYYLNSKWTYVPYSDDRFIQTIDEFHSVGAANTVSGSLVLTSTGSITPTADGARFSTAASTTGRAVVFSGSNGVFGGWIDLDNGTAYCKVNIKAISALSSITDEYTLRVGLGDVTAGADFVNGLYVEYDRLSSTNWRYASASASSRTKTNSSTAVTAAAHYIEVFYNGTQAEYWVDGTSLGTISTNIPTAIIGPVIQLQKLTGTTPITVDIDRIKAWHYLTTSRN